MDTDSTVDDKLISRKIEDGKVGVTDMAEGEQVALFAIEDKYEMKARLMMVSWGSCILDKG